MNTRAFLTRLAAAAGVCGASLFGLPAAAQYPDKPIRLVVPWPAGGGTDVLARAVSKSMGDLLKQPVIVDNKPGANGSIGSDFVARAPKDGYTLLVAVTDSHAISPHIFSKIAYDPRRDFASVGNIGFQPYVLVVNQNFPASNVSEYVAYAKKNPGKVSFASWGNGSSGHLASEMLKAQSAFDTLHVPYQGAAPGLQAVVAGQVDSMFLVLPSAIPQAQAGKIKMIGLAAPKRFADTGNLQTFAEQGVPVTIGTWYGIMAPAGTPKEVLARLNEALNTAMESPSVREVLRKLYTEPQAMTGEQFQGFVDAEYERWGKIVRQANIKVE